MSGSDTPSRLPSSASQEGSELHTTSPFQSSAELALESGELSGLCLTVQQWLVSGMESRLGLEENVFVS